MKRATVALARRLAVILHRIWVDGSGVPVDPRTNRGNRMRTGHAGVKQDRRTLELHRAVE